jgi:alpha/beta superfamily hydrolase
MSLTAIVRRTLALLLAYLSAQAHAQAELLTYKEVLERPGRPEPDQRFAYGPEAGQSAELWLPRGHAGGPLPVAVLVHGGCWVSDYPGAELVAWLADALRAQGVAVWSITYRRVGLERNTMGGGYPATFLDAGAALDYLRVVAPGHGLDLSRVVTTGHSAGGHLALWLAARPRLPADSPLRVAAPLPVKAVVSLAGLPELPYAAEVAAHACGAGTVAKLVDLEHRGEARVARHVGARNAAAGRAADTDQRRLRRHRAAGARLALPRPRRGERRGGRAAQSRRRRAFRTDRAVDAGGPRGRRGDRRRAALRALQKRDGVRAHLVFA